MEKKTKSRRYFKPHTIPWYKRELDVEFNKLVTSLGYCEKCGSRVNQLNCSHVLPKGHYGSLRYDIMNVTCICAYCHQWFWHDNPIEATKWFKEKYPDRFTYLEAVKNIHKKFTLEDYENILKAVRSKNLSQLITFPT